MKRAFLFLAVLLFAITTEVIAANGVLGPHPMTYEAATPSGYGKVVVTSNPEYTGGWIELTLDLKQKINPRISFNHHPNKRRGYQVSPFYAIWHLP